MKNLSVVKKSAKRFDAVNLSKAVRWTQSHKTCRSVRTRSLPRSRTIASCGSRLIPYNRCRGFVIFPMSRICNISTHFVLRIMPAVAADHADCQSAVSSRRRRDLFCTFSNSQITTLSNFQILQRPPVTPIRRGGDGISFAQQKFTFTHSPILKFSNSQITLVIPTKEGSLLRSKSSRSGIHQFSNSQIFKLPH